VHEGCLRLLHAPDADAVFELLDALVDGTVVRRDAPRGRPTRATPPYVARTPLSHDHRRFGAVFHRPNDMDAVTWAGVAAARLAVVSAPAPTEAMTAELAREVLDQLPVQVFVKRRDGRFVWVNAATARFLGRSAVEFRGLYDQDVFDERVADRLRAEDRHVFETGEHHQTVESFEQSGRRHWFQSRKQLLRVVDGEPLLLGFRVDITDRRKAEQKVRQRDARTRALLQALPDIVFRFRGDGLFLDVHAPNMQQFGPSEGIIGKHLSEVLPAWAAERIVHAAWLVLESGEMEVVEYDVAIEGDLRHYEARIGSSGPDEFVAVVRDATDRTRHEQRLREAKAAAEQANRAKSTFLANMSHELRTPMNGILGMSELVREQVDSPEIRQQVQIIRDSGEHLLRLVNDLLDLSRVEAGKIVLESEPFDLVELIDTLVTTFRRSVEQRGLALRVEVDPEVPRFLRGDAPRLRQILTNLIGNAVKFTRDGHVTVFARPASEDIDRVRVRFAVVDTGIGIPANRIERIFEAFTQADSTTTREYGGSGLGLTITRQLVDMMGGSLTVDSEVGRGSTFTFDVELERADARPRTVQMSEHMASPAIERTDAASGGPQRVLLVEDNRVNQLVARRMLERAGHEVVVADNGRDALLVLQKDAGFAAVFMDVQMPVMDGIAATRAIRLDPALRHLPVIALTAHAMSGDAERCLQAGMDFYLSKPVRASDLLDALETVGSTPFDSHPGAREPALQDS